MGRPGLSGAIAFCVLPTCWALSTTAHAAGPEPEKEAIHLDYVAEGRCPERPRILSELGQHTDNWQLAEPGARKRRFVLHIEHRDAQYVGRLEIRSTDGEVAAGSEIRGPDCEDVALGLTLAVALALDPRANAPPVGLASIPPAEGASPPYPTDREVAEAPASAPTPPSPPSRPEPARAPIEAPHGSWDLGAGVRIEASRGVAGVLGGGSLYGEIGWAGPVRWFAPKLRLGGRRTLATEFEANGGHVDLALTAALAELCPVALALGPSVEASACVQGSVGVLSASATNIADARDAQRLWLDYGGLGTMRWWLHRRVSLEASLGLSVPITRDRIRVEADAVVTRADTVVVLGSVGVLYRFKID